jgi:hypothetical protein
MMLISVIIGLEKKHDSKCFEDGVVSCFSPFTSIRAVSKRVGVVSATGLGE